MIATFCLFKHGPKLTSRGQYLLSGLCGVSLYKAMQIDYWSTAKGHVLLMFSV